MNEFDKKYGNGDKWYLNPDNYKDDMIDDPDRRDYIYEFYAKIDLHKLKSLTKLQTSEIGFTYRYLFKDRRYKRKA